MHVKDAIRARRAVRSYTEQEVPQETIIEMFENVRLAPSASNKQTWKFIAVTEEGIKNRLYEAGYNQEFLKEAPVVIAGISTEPDYIMSCDVKSGPINVAIALDHLSLRAVEKGLGTCWIGRFEQESVKEILDIPPDWKVIELMTLGYPENELEADTKDRKSRKDILTIR